GSPVVRRDRAEGPDDASKHRTARPPTDLRAIPRPRPQLVARFLLVIATRESRVINCVLLPVAGRWQRGRDPPRDLPQFDRSGSGHATTDVRLSPISSQAGSQVCRHVSSSGSRSARLFVAPGGAGGGAVWRLDEGG